MPHRWDYLILTASNNRQAAGYERQLAARTACGSLDDVGQALVVADPLGNRVGSGGSTLYCLMRVLQEECRKRSVAPKDWDEVEAIFRRLRVLILHAGGDSRRVPAYGPCGKIFAPVPGAANAAVPATLFDRLYPLFQSLPANHTGDGQILVAAGDALIVLDPSHVHWDRLGVVAVGVASTPEAASKHGVFCVAPDGRVRLVLQKPSLDEQARHHALRDDGQTVLDVGLMHFNAAAAVEMMRALDMQIAGDSVALPPEGEALILDQGLDLYREMTCSLGYDATVEHHLRTCRGSGSKWPADALARLFNALHRIPMYCEVVPHCSFLHFGTTRQLITSGKELLALDGAAVADGILSVNNHITAHGSIAGCDSWIEGCRIDGPLMLGGENAVIGVDITLPLELPRGAVLDVIVGRVASDGTSENRPIWFVRCYHVADTFKDAATDSGTLCGVPLLQWLEQAGATPDDLWDPATPPAQRSLWNARAFPAVDSSHGFRDWLWMYDPLQATVRQKLAYRKAPRFSVAEMAILADMNAFYERRTTLCTTH